MPSATGGCRLGRAVKLRHYPAERYEALLARSRGLRLVDLDRPLLRAAAQLRATAGLKTPDALQIAAALRARCGVFLTNDRTLPSIPGIRVLQLRDFARG
jgi:predicted nucleic acid-binding protein